MSIEQDALDTVLRKLARTSAEFEETVLGFKPPAPCDTEVKESKPSKWLALADSICHEPYRRKL